MPCSSTPNEPAELSRELAALPRRGVVRLCRPELTPGQVALYMGMPSAQAGGPVMERSIRGALALVEPLLHPVAAWGLPDIIALHQDGLTLTYPEDGAPICVPCKARLFRGASMVQISLLTLGPGFDELLAELYDRDPLVAMACDAAASAALAAAGRQLLDHRRGELQRHGLEMSITYSPGCQALPLTAQRQVFALIDSESVGVVLSDACLMQPAKSATSVAPVGAALPAWMKRVTACELCNLRQTCRFQATHPAATGG